MVKILLNSRQVCIGSVNAINVSFVIYGVYITFHRINVQPLLNYVATAKDVFLRWLFYVANCS